MQSPITESPPSIDIHEVKRDLEKEHYWCIPYLTQSSMGARTLNLGDSVFLYIGTRLIGVYQPKLEPVTKTEGKRTIYIVIIGKKSLNVS